ncbi:Uncharacterised protein [Halioglobus japonicus]|nr:Uncharacterised protein [Halioglobus japonicus]
MRTLIFKPFQDALAGVAQSGRPAVHSDAVVRRS